WRRSGLIVQSQFFLSSRNLLPGVRQATLRRAPPLFQSHPGSLLDRGRSTLSILTNIPIAEAIDKVIVYHSNRLHVGINDRRTDKAESPALEVLAECL